MFTTIIIASFVGMPIAHGVLNGISANYSEMEGFEKVLYIAFVLAWPLTIAAVLVVPVLQVVYSVFHCVGIVVGKVWFEGLIRFSEKIDYTR